MLIDTHCHINMMVKKSFDTILTPQELGEAKTILHDAHAQDVTTIINVGTSLPESKNCVALAQTYPTIKAAVGIHPNDCTSTWKDELRDIKQLVQKHRTNIVAIGECGLDFHYPDYNLTRQQDAFKAQIELALEHDLALIIHTRDARDETARIMQEYKNDIKRGIVHCFSEDLDFAHVAIDLGYALGIGGAVTYPKNERLRIVATQVPLSCLVLETDAPFLPPQEIRGKQNHPKYIAAIAQYIAQLRHCTFEEVALATAQRATKIFNLSLP